MMNLLRKLLPALFFSAIFHTSVFAIDCGLSWSVFSAEGKPYVEISFEISAASVTFKPVDTLNLQASVDVLLLLKQGDKVVNYEKYRLQSPLVSLPRTLLDLKRLAVPGNGEYTLELSLQDAHDAENNATLTRNISILIGNGLYMSELQLLRQVSPAENPENPFVKNGLYMEPLPFNFYDRDATAMTFYAEVYNAEKVIPAGTPYVVRYMIDEELGNGQRKQVSLGNQRKKPMANDRVLVQLDISKLPSGNYFLQVELYNHLNELINVRNLSFQRSNPFLDINNITNADLKKQFVSELNEKDLRYCLRALSPLQRGTEVETIRTILKSGDTTQMQFFVFRWFAERSPNNPREAYEQFLELANAVDKKFYTAYGYGFENDRGRIFMKYGKPDDMIHVEDEPSAPPYEIWIYYNFPRTNQKNVKFLFYNPTLAGEDYVLLHSTARGEINNPRWERELYKRNANDQQEGDDYNSSTTMKRNIYRNARVYFEDL
ncbi:MAG: GWxTD domain-containing protein [Chitinophagales bacterium]|nr:GWxTD domain-containing protein [Chitinophagales bacterium]